jgi:hypothetical protein
MWKQLPPSLHSQPLWTKSGLPEVQWTVVWAANLDEMLHCPFGCPLLAESAHLSGDYWNGQPLYQFSRFHCWALSGLRSDYSYSGAPINKLNFCRATETIFVMLT